MKKITQHLPSEAVVASFTRKMSVSLCYAILASVALNFFWQPGNIYASGITGLSQLIKTIVQSNFGVTIPISFLLIALNCPLLILAWYKLGKKFTFYCVVTVLLTSLMVQIIPEQTLSDDPIICGIFGGAINGFAIGFGLKNGVSSGGLDIISLTIRKKTGKSVGSIGIIFNAFIVFMAGALFGWPYMFYSALSIFVSGKVMDVVYTKQQKMQVLIVTQHPDEVVSSIQEQLRRGISIINDTEGAYRHEKQFILLTVITRNEMGLFIKAMRHSDPKAFVSISDNVKIIGNFYEPDI